MLMSSLMRRGVMRVSRHPMQLSLNSARHFSTEKPPQEYKVDEEELFGEKKMQEAQKSIGEKLKAIKQQQSEQEAAGEVHTHDPNNFSFVRTTKL